MDVMSSNGKTKVLHELKMISNKVNKDKIRVFPKIWVISDLKSINVAHKKIFYIKRGLKENKVGDNSTSVRNQRTTIRLIIVQLNNMKCNVYRSLTNIRINKHDVGKRTRKKKWQNV